MRPGDIDGREINAVTINSDLAAAIYTLDNGYKICIHAGRMKAIIRGISALLVPPACETFIAKALCTSFVIPAKRDCVS